MVSWFGNTRTKLQQGGKVHLARPPRLSIDVPKKLFEQPSTNEAGITSPMTPVPVQRYAFQVASISLATVVASITCLLSDLDPRGEAVVAGPHSLASLAQQATTFLALQEYGVPSCLHLSSTLLYPNAPSFHPHPGHHFGVVD